jgi:hypothetical protein
LDKKGRTYAANRNNPIKTKATKTSIEEKNILVDESKIAQIDLLQIKIQELDRILGEE